MQIESRKTSLAEGIAAGFMFGTAAIFVRFLPGVNGFLIVFWRAIIACFALILVLLMLKKPFTLGLVIQNFKQLFVLGFLLSVHLMLFVFAVKDTTILNATVLVNTTPFFSLLVSNFIFKGKPSPRQILGLSVSFIGVSIIALAASQAPAGGGFHPSLKGDLEALFAAVAEAFYLNYGKELRNQMNIFSLMLPIYATTAVLAGATILIDGTAAFTFSTQEVTVLSLFGLGLIPTAIAHTLYFSSLSSLKSFETATLALLEPVGATVLGALIFHEIPATVFVLGAAIISVGIIFIGTSQNMREDRLGRAV
jgi:drug/metabolite transporter (DMT)-like permease